MILYLIGGLIAVFYLALFCSELKTKCKFSHYISVLIFSWMGVGMLFVLKAIIEGHLDSFIDDAYYLREERMNKE